MKLYSLFEKQDGKWVRLSKLSFGEGVALWLWRGPLLDSARGGTSNERRIKSVKPEDSEFWK